LSGYQTAIQATSNGGTAIVATVDPNTGQNGVNRRGWNGIYGFGQTTGVRGESNTGTGVYGVRSRGCALCGLPSRS
jgi:hypothetical protein